MRVVVLSAGVCVLAVALPAFAQRGPAPASVGLPAEVISLACAPAFAYEESAATLRISGGQESVRHISYAPGDLVTLNAGTRSGITVGQEFYTRRRLTLEPRDISPSNPAAIRTTGWIRVWAVDDDMSLATISHACDSVDVGDYLEPFTPPIVPAASDATGKPERGNYARVLFGQDRRRSFGQHDFMMIDRGSSQGVTVGARFVIYHEQNASGNFLFEIGEAIAVDVRGDTSTLHIIRAIDAITEGDYAGMRK